MYSKESVIDWIKTIGGEASSVEREGTEWLVQGIHNEMTFAVVRPSSEDRIIIQRAISFSEEHMTNQEQSDEADRIRFLNKLKRDLLLSSARYRFQADKEDSTITRLMIVESYIYDDAATKHNFFNAYFDVIDASILCILAVAEHFGK